MRAIAAALSIPVQLAGGVRTLARAAELLAASFKVSLDLPEALQAVGSERLQDPPPAQGG